MDTNARHSDLNKTDAAHDVAQHWRGRAGGDSAALASVGTRRAREPDRELAQLAVVPAAGDKVRTHTIDTLSITRPRPTALFLLISVYQTLFFSVSLWCSEFLAEENPLYFWQFLDEIEARAPYVKFIGDDVDELGTLAVAVAEAIAPGSKNVTWHKHFLYTKCG